MSLEKSSIVWSAKQISGMVKNGKIDFTHIVQRSFVWERARKSSLIESMILGYPVPHIYAKRLEDGTGKRGGNTYFIMDGKQRLSTVKEFLNDEFALTQLPPVTFYDEQAGCECEADISDLKFSELPEALRDYINTITFSITYFDNLTSNEERELFRRLNNGKPLTAKNKALASCKDIKELLDIGSHKLFDECMTEKARESKGQAIVVMKAWCMLNQEVGTVSFETKKFNPMLEEIEISDSEKLELNEVFNMIVAIHDVLVERKEKKVAKKLYTETHMISLIPFIKKAIENGLDTDLVADWITDFYSVDGKAASKSDDYNMACQGGNAKNMNILTRHDELEASFLDFFKIDEETYYTDEQAKEEQVEDTEEDEVVDEAVDEAIEYAEEEEEVVETETETVEAEAEAEE